MKQFLFYYFGDISFQHYRNTHRNTQCKYKLYVGIRFSTFMILPQTIQSLSLTLCTYLKIQVVKILRCTQATALQLIL